MDEVDDPVAMVVARLQSVSPHVCKVCMSHVQYVSTNLCD
jgi:hypothetical protein